VWFPQGPGLFPGLASSGAGGISRACYGCCSSVLRYLTSLASSWVGYLAMTHLATPAPCFCGYRTWGQQGDALVSSEMDI